MTAPPPPVPEVPVLMTKGHVLLGICVLLSAVPVVHVGGRACMHACTGELCAQCAASVWANRCMHG